jgi:hypothetical protein
MIVAETGRRYPTIPEWLLNEQIRSRGEHTHHYAEHVAKDEFVSRVVRFDGPEPFKEAVCGLERERDLMILIRKSSKKRQDIPHLMNPFILAPISERGQIGSDRI